MAELSYVNNMHRLSGSINPRGQFPAICIPTFSSREDNNTYAQYIGIDSLILKFELAEDTGWIYSSTRPHEDTDVGIGASAIYWVALKDDGSSPLIGARSTIRSELISQKHRIAAIDNPFERLDFAQLADDMEWFAEEANECEASFNLKEELTEWLERTLLLTRARFAVDSMAVTKSASRPMRRKLGMVTRTKLDSSKISLFSPISPLLPDIFSEQDYRKIDSFLQSDLVCKYAVSRLQIIRSGARIIRKSPVFDAPPVLSSSNVTGTGWWRSASDLDAEQMAAYRWPLDGNYLLKGPPGSGKTNILILRASYIASTGQSNVRLLTYTRVLREFVASGCGDYINFPAEQVMTVAGWINEFLDERGISRPETRNLTEQQAWDARLDALRKASEGIEDFYDGLLVDEAQDLPGELLWIMHKLTPRLFMVGDTNQRIFEKDDRDSGMVAAEAIADSVVSLSNHYRIGPNICIAGNRLIQSAVPLSATCRYNSPLGSRVEAHQIDGIQGQCEELIPRLVTQQRIYGITEPIGIIVGRRSVCDEIFEFLSTSEIGPATKVMSSGSSEPWYDADRPICIMTIQAAKGSEFRAVHWLDADDVPFYTRQKAYVVITRAKTSVDVYYSKKLPSSLASALNQLRPPKAPF